MEFVQLRSLGARLSPLLLLLAWGCAGQPDSPASADAGTVEEVGEAGSEKGQPPTATDRGTHEPALADASVAWTILSDEVLMKGASLDPPLKPTYRLLRVEAAIEDQEVVLTKETLERTLGALITELRQNHEVDGICAAARGATRTR